MTKLVKKLKKKTNQRTCRVAGVTCVDATKDIILELLPKDINKAKRKSNSECSLAIACRRQLGHEARIHLTKVYISRNGGGKIELWDRYIVPLRLRTEIVAFDRGGEMQPGEYTLKAPIGFNRIGARNGRQEAYRKRKQNGKRNPRITITGVRLSALKHAP